MVQWRFVLCLVLVLFVATAPSMAGDRLPVPTAVELKESQAAVKEIFKADLATAKSSSQMAEVAERMLANIEDKSSSAAIDYALLIQAQALAAKASNISLCKRIVGLISQRYEVNRLQLSVQAFKELSKGPTDKAYHQALADETADLIAESIRDEALDVTAQCYELMSSLGVKLKSADIAKRAASGKAELPELQKLIDQAPSAKEKLALNVADARSIDVLGRYLVLIKSDWNQGLPLLAKNSDAAIARVAQQDQGLVDSPLLASVEDAEAVGSSWLDLSQKQSLPRAKTEFKLRAGQWFEYALPGLKGLSKTKAEQRLSESGWKSTAELVKQMPLNRHELELRGLFDRAYGIIADDFAILQMAEYDALKKLSEAMTLRKYRPIRIRPYSTPDGLKFGAIWVRDSMNGELFEGSESEVKERDEQNRGRGLVPIDVAGYLSSDRSVRYVLTSGPKVDAPTQHIELQLGILDGKQVELLNTQGLYPLTFHALAHSDNKFYSNMVCGRFKRGWHLRAGPIEWHLKSRDEHKFVTADVGVALFGSTLRYFSSFYNDSNVNEVVGHSKSPEETLEAWKQLASDGARPATFTAAVDAGGKYYSYWTWKLKTAAK